MLCCPMGVSHMLLSFVMLVHCRSHHAMPTVAGCVTVADAVAFFFILEPQLLTELLMLIMVPVLARRAISC